MRRQLIKVVLVFMLVRGGILQAQATERGIIRVSMDHGMASAESASVTLYPVGIPVENGYRLLESLGGGLVRQEDVQMADLAQWLEEKATEAGQTKYLRQDGTTEFEDLQTGLYLLIQTDTAEGFRKANPFLVPVPWNGSLDVTVLPSVQELWTESPKTGQHPAPLIGAMVMVLSGMGLVVCLDKIRKK